MNSHICPQTGIIQLKKYPNFKDIYISAHNTSFGKVWNNLFKIFTNNIKQYTQKSNIILEIGGGALLLASKILKNNDIDVVLLYSI